MGDAVLIVAAITTAVVATATFVSKRWLEMKEFASRVYVSPESEDENQLAVVVKNAGEGPVQYLGVALFSWGKPRMTWRWRRSQADWWTGARVAGRFVPMISPRGETESIAFPAERVSRTHIAGFPPFIIEFTDCAGTRWVRWPDGKLSWRPKRKFRLTEYD